MSASEVLGFEGSAEEQKLCRVLLFLSLCLWPGNILLPLKGVHCIACILLTWLVRCLIALRSDQHGLEHSKVTMQVASKSRSSHPACHFLCLHRARALPPETMQHSLQVDIYSFGVVLWELVTRCTPRIGGMREMHVPHECPQVVADLIAWCLCPEPHERPSAHQVLAFLAPKCGPLCNADRA